MKNNHWTIESCFSTTNPPINVDEVIDEANRLIDAGADADKLWETFCATGAVGDVKAMSVSDAEYSALVDVVCDVFGQSNIAETIANHYGNYLTINTARSGREVVSYYDGEKFAARYVDDLSALSEEDFEREVC